MRILIVEDEPAHAEAIRRAFKAAEPDIEIVVAASLKEFRSSVAERLPDIAIMDMNLPDGRAIEVLTHPPENGDFPALVMTSYGNEQVAVEAMKAGALDYLVKSAETFAAMPRSVSRAMREWSLLQERRRTEDALRKSESRFRQLSGQFNALLDAIPDSITLQSPDLKVLWANNSAAAWQKKKPEELVGRHCYEFWHHKSEPCDRCPVLKSFRTCDEALEIITAPNGRTWELRSIPVREDGIVANVIEVARDVTEQRKLEAKYLHAQKMESIGTLAGGIAHDFNNILTAIIGYGEFALMKMAADDPHRSNIHSILEAADRAAHLTRELLLFSRKQVGERKPVDLNDVIQKGEKFLRRVIGEDIEFKVTLHDSSLPVNADGHQLEQVLMNLATNARDALPGGGTFSIKTGLSNLGEDYIAAHGYGKPGPYALITATDNGNGMENETRERVFEPFFTTKEVGKGTGLGLSVAYGIIKQHEGYINVQSVPGGGTEFMIYLPIISEDLTAEIARCRQQVLNRGTETVLLAEDDEAVRNMSQALLTECGYKVIAAVDGEDAVRKFMTDKETIDLLIFDLVMPRKSGYDAFEEIRNEKPGIKIIFMSGYAPDYVQQKVKNGENVHQLQKPSSPPELLEKVRSVLDSKGCPQPERKEIHAPLC
jgi:signal transduction histidine kinase/DNA-binding response OmpR family regulator